MAEQNARPKKIIHVDMDCFYAAIEERDTPQLRGKPVAVGGTTENRGVICTANYVARNFGVRSAISTAKALQLCPNLILIPPNIKKYKQISTAIRELFSEYTDIIEPLSLDEAYLDVSASSQFKGSASLIAKDICYRIYQAHQLTASAGVAPNKFLAKVASDWQKPAGLFTISPDDVSRFVSNLPIEKISGVGPVTSEKLKSLGLYSCQDIQAFPKQSLIRHFGKFAEQLSNFAIGYDPREVQPNRTRKSLSIEDTFSKDLTTPSQWESELSKIVDKLEVKLQATPNQVIKKMFVKIKFSNFVSTTIECVTSKVQKEIAIELLNKGLERQKKPIRLLGVGVRFPELSNHLLYEQLNYYHLLS